MMDQLQMQQAQLEAARAQREMYEAQTRMLQQNLIANSGDIAFDVPENLIAESGAVSLRYKPPKLGERAIGPKSNFPPKVIQFANDQELGPIDI